MRYKPLIILPPNCKVDEDKAKPFVEATKKAVKQAVNRFSQGTFMKFVKNDIVKYQGVECQVLGYDFMTGEYQVKTPIKTMFVDGSLFEKYGSLTQGSVIHGFDTYEPPPIPDKDLWCDCRNEDKQLVRVRVLHKDHAICRTCKKEDKSYYGEKFLKGELK